MGSPSVSYQMLADGYRITSGNNGFRAQASFICAWQDAFTMHDEIMGYASAAVVGPLTYNAAWQFPGSTSARLFATSCEITPFALEGGPAPITVAKGMAPGEFWSHARLDVVFEAPTYPQTGADDPGNINQIDPSAPIYGCEQVIRVGSKSEVKEKTAFQFDGLPLVPVTDDVTIYRGESSISLNYPFVPFVPWKKYRPFNNSVNNAVFLDCGIGELLFQGVEINSAQGPQGKLGKSLRLEFLVNDVDWNKQPLPESGTATKIKLITTGANPYLYKDFSQLLLS